MNPRHLKSEAAALAVAVAFPILFVLAPPSSAVPGRESARAYNAVEEVRRVMAPTRDLVDSTRAALSDGTVAGALDAALAAAGIALTPIPAAQAPITSAGVGNTELRPLITAAKRALRVLRANAPSRHSLLIEPVVAPDMVGEGEVIRVALPSLVGGAEQLELRGSESMLQAGPVPDPEAPDEAMVAAARELAAAVDWSLPVLARLAASSKARGTEGSGCDVVDQLPQLCVGGDGDNVYVENSLVQIDLGGNDTYLNSAGGAANLGWPVGDLQPLGLTIDVAGDDTYRPASLSCSGDPVFRGQTVQARCIVGSGATLGASLGWLIDMAGDDRYEAAGETLKEDERSWVVAAQGSAGRGGIALLHDADGNDSYLASGPQWSEGTLEEPAFPFIYIRAQGVGIGGGLYESDEVPAADPRDTTIAVGLLNDLGEGHDDYSIASLGSDIPADRDLGPAVEIFGQGATKAFAVPHTTGILSDAGGPGLFSVTATARRVGIEGYEASMARPKAEVFAQGLGWASAGLLLAGAGDNTYEISTDDEGFNRRWVWGQGASYGVLNGTGVLSDRGGDDSYRVRSAMTADVTHSCDDAGASSGSCTDLRQSAGDCIGSVCNISLEVLVQGANVTGGQGLLEDGGGDDSYEVSSVVLDRVTLRDQRTDGAGPLRLEAVGYLPTLLRAQGAASSGDAALWDESGSDHYEIRSSNETESIIESPEGRPVKATAYSTSNDRVNGQGSGGSSNTGAGSGSLVNLASGGRDEFIVDVSNRVTTIPDSGRAFQGGFPIPGVQGSSTGNAPGILFAPDAQLVTSAPSAPVCEGSSNERGFGSWLECKNEGSRPSRSQIDRQGYAASLSPGLSGAVGQASVLTAPTSVGEASQGQALPVVARLTEATGTPIAGAPIHFFLQYRIPYLLPPLSDIPVAFWFNVLRVDGVTDVDGNARVTLPEMDPEVVLVGAPVQLFATYDGSLGVYPAHAATSLNIEPASAPIGSSADGRVTLPRVPQLMGT